VATLYQKVEIFDIFGPHSHPPMAIEVKFSTAKKTHVTVSPAKLDLNRCNELPLWGEKPDFWPVSRFNAGSFDALRHPAGNKRHKVQVAKVQLPTLFIMWSNENLM